MFYNDTLGKYISAQMIAKRKERIEKKNLWNSNTCQITGIRSQDCNNCYFLTPYGTVKKMTKS